MCSSKRTQRLERLWGALVCLTVSPQMTLNFSLRLCVGYDQLVHQHASLAGHGGPNAADFVRQNLFDSVIKNPKFSTDIKTAFGERLHSCIAKPEQLAYVWVHFFEIFTMHANLHCDTRSPCSKSHSCACPSLRVLWLSTLQAVASICMWCLQPTLSLAHASGKACSLVLMAYTLVFCS